MYTINYISEKSRAMRRINRCLNPQLVSICLQSYQVDKINDIFQSLLPEHLRGHCQVVSFIRGKLAISVNDSTFATELRYLIPSLRDSLRREHQLYQLIQCDIVINDLHNEPFIVPNKIKVREVNKNAKRSIESLAETVDYPPLKQALVQWAKHMCIQTDT